MSDYTPPTIDDIKCTYRGGNIDNNDIIQNPNDTKNDIDTFNGITSIINNFNNKKHNRSLSKHSTQSHHNSILHNTSDYQNHNRSNR